jgi:carotenoid cleavage dioxygenase-like enzyme
MFTARYLSVNKLSYAAEQVKNSLARNTNPPHSDLAERQQHLFDNDREVRSGAVREHVGPVRLCNHRNPRGRFVPTKAPLNN